jgi:uncharacterized protein (DUF983 family)
VDLRAREMLVFFGHGSQPSIFGFLIAGGGVLAFGSRLRRRRASRNPTWSDFTIWFVYTFVPAAGLLAFGAVLGVLVVAVVSGH